MLTRDQLEALSKADLVELCLQLQALVAEQQARIQQLEARVAELERRLGQNSRNSHKPPSSDGLARRTVSSREPSGRKPGGQPGHEGTTLRMVEQPDRVKPHVPPVCPGCGRALAGLTGTVCERRQVIELVPKLTEVIEHQAMEVVCPGCRQAVRGRFPDGVDQAVQFGAGLKGLMVYLQTYQLLPYERTAEFCTDVLALGVSEGTLDSARLTSAENLAGVTAAIKVAIGSAPVVGFDETGVRIAGKLDWLHTARTDTLTHYETHRRRGSVAMDEIGILPVYRGTAEHDGLAAYRLYPCRHALCNSHHLRELKAINQDPGQEWAGRMRGLLCEIKQCVDEAKAAGAVALAEPVLRRFTRRYDELIRAGRRANPHGIEQMNRGRLKRTPAQNLLNRLAEDRAAVLLFMHDFQVPFDNNGSERDLRMMKVKQKVSGCFRSTEGAAAFCRIRGYISTLRKQGLPVLPALQSTLRGAPVMPDLG